LTKKNIAAMSDNKKYDYSNFIEIRVTNVPKQLKRTIAQDRKQKGITESALVKGILDDYYQKNPLVINPHFLED
jgi:hypothetical protein